MLCSTSYTDAAGRVTSSLKSDELNLPAAKRVVRQRWTADERAHRRQLAVMRQRELFQQLFGVVESQLAAS